MLVDELPDVLRPLDLESRRHRFQELLASDGVILSPGVYDSFSARIVESLGFDTAYLGSGNFCASHYGSADMGILSPHDMAAASRRIAAAVSVPVIVDVDTGYGGPFQVAVHLPEIVAAGAAGAQIEDQVLPKRCGHLDGKSLVSTGEMCRKIEVARGVTPTDFAIIARTDAVAVEGLDAAIARAHAYVDAGADLIFIEAPLSDDMLQQIADAQIQRPLIANMVFGGATPLRSKSELQAMGYKMVIYAGAAIQAAGAAVRECLGGLLESGELPNSVTLLALAERTELVQQKRWNALHEQTNRPLDD
jgi:2-methylisocitrate lyase-like PEP mutase family enzyme